MPNTSVRRLEWVLGGLLAISLILVLGFLFFYWNRSQSDSDTQSKPPLTAREAFNKAEPIAQNWASDAQLVNARTTWNLTDEAVTKLDWSLIFYSPSQQMTALLAVDAFDVTLLRTRPSANPVTPANIADWKLDSPEVVDNLFADFTLPEQERAGDTILTLTLNLVGQPTWTAALNNEETQLIWLKLDATNGTTIDIYHP